jgi:hypothetical protein
MIKSRRMRGTGHVVPMKQRRGAYRVFVGKPEEKEHLEDPSINWRKILRWIFRKRDGSIYRIDLAQDMDRWRAVVKAVMNFQVP